MQIAKHTLLVFCISLFWFYQSSFQLEIEIPSSFSALFNNVFDIALSSFLLAIGYLVIGFLLNKIFKNISADSVLSKLSLPFWCLGVIATISLLGVEVTNFFIISKYVFIITSLVAVFLLAKKSISLPSFDSDPQNSINFGTKILPLIAIIASIVIFFGPVFFSSKVITPNGLTYIWKPFSNYAPRAKLEYNPVASDFTDSLFPHFAATYNAVMEEGEWPLTAQYNTNNTNNATLLASSLYSIDFGSFLLFGTDWGWTVAVLLRFLLAGLFTYLLLREYRLEKLSSVFGSIVLCYSCFSIVNTLLPYVYTLPLLFYVTEKLLTKRKLLYCYPLLIAYLCIIASGQFVWSIHLVTLQGFYVLFRLFLLDISFKEKSRLLGLFFIAGISSILLISFLILPSLEHQSFLDLGYRESRSLWHHPYIKSLMFVFPQISGSLLVGSTWGSNVVENAAYFGLIPLILVLLAFTMKLPVKGYFYLAAGVVVYFVVTNTFSILEIVRQIPFYDSSNNTRVRFLWALILPVLSAFAFNKILLSKSSKLPVIQILVSIAVLVSSLLVLYSCDTKPYIVDFSNPIVSEHVFSQSILLFVSVGLVIAFLLVRNKNLLAMLLILITFFDLYSQFSSYIKYLPKKFVTRNMKVVNYLHENQEEESRFMPINRAFIANFHAPYDLNSIQPRGFYTQRQREVFQLIDPNAMAKHPTMAFFVPAETNYQSKIIDLFNVKHLVNYNNTPLADNLSDYWKLVYKREVEVYENIEGFAPGFITQNVVIEKDSTQIIEKLKSIDPTSTAIIEDTNWKFDFEEPLTRKTIKLLESSNNRYLYRVRSNQNSFLMLSHFYHPAWKVYIDDQKAPTTIANYVFLGVNLPKGSKLVELKFEPSGFKEGLYVSAIAGSILLLCFLMLSFRKKAEN